MANPEFPRTGHEGPFAALANLVGRVDRRLAAGDGRLAELTLRLNTRARREGRGYACRAPLAFGGTARVRTNDTVGRFLHYFGTWEPQLTLLVEAVLEPGDTFIDVGANLGYYAMLAASLVGPDGEVHAFEASSAIFSVLQANLVDNDLTAVVHAENVAVADAPGEVALYLGPPDNRGNTSMFDLGRHAPAGTIRADRLPSLVGPDAWSRAKMIKIDVEGAEKLVLDGAVDRLDELRDDVVVLLELNHAGLARAGTSAEAVLAPLLARGHRMWSLPNEYRFEFYQREHRGLEADEITAVGPEVTDVALSRRPLPVGAAVTPRR